ncbi:hypothetical protein QXB71_002640 [Vibrio cholerae]|nr:hypothetical protein [Vibrio cholerae]
MILVERRKLANILLNHVNSKNQELSEVVAGIMRAFPDLENEILHQRKGLICDKLSEAYVKVLSTFTNDPIIHHIHSQGNLSNVFKDFLSNLTLEGMNDFLIAVEEGFVNTLSDDTRFHECIKHHFSGDHAINFLKGNVVGFSQSELPNNENKLFFIAKLRVQGTNTISTTLSSIPVPSNAYHFRISAQRHINSSLGNSIKSEIVSYNVGTPSFYKDHPKLDKVLQGEFVDIGDVISPSPKSQQIVVNYLICQVGNESYCVVPYKGEKLVNDFSSVQSDVANLLGISDSDHSFKILHATSSKDEIVGAFPNLNGIIIDHPIEVAEHDVRSLNLINKDSESVDTLSLYRI